MDLTRMEGKDDILGIPGDPTKMSDTAWTKALDTTSTHFTQLVDGHFREYNIVQGYLDAHPGALSQFQNVRASDGSLVSFVDQNGRLDWGAIRQYQSDFDRMYDELFFTNPTVHVGQQWDSNEHGYQSGLRDSTINSVNLPAPQNGNEPPR